MVIALIALVAVPLWVGARTQSIRQELRSIVEPARAEAFRMVTQFDREVAAVRGFRISEDPYYLGRSRAAREQRLDAFAKLQPLIAPLNPTVQEMVDRFHQVADDWERAHWGYVSPGTAEEEGGGQAAMREGQYDIVIMAGDRLEARLRRETADRRDRIQQEERRGLALSAILALLALAAALVVTGITRRLRVFVGETERLYRESQELATELGSTVAALEQRTEERERLATGIERQRQVLRTVTDNASSALLMMDAEGRGTFWNPAAERITGYSAEEALGQRIHDLIHHSHPDGSAFPVEQCPIHQVMPSGVELQGHEDQFIRRNGEFFPVICTAKPIVEEGGAARMLIEIRDVTEEKQAEEALRRAKEQAEDANRAKSEFLATMSHELRTPLNAILGFTDLMELGVPVPLPPSALSQVKRIDDSARHLLRIIEEILTFSRIEAEQEKVAAEATDLRGVVRSAVEVMQPLASKKGLTLVSELDKAPESIQSDAQKIWQILVNLLDNAIKFTEAGAVKVVVWQDNTQVVICVHDTGIGIPPEHLSRVFDPFWQVDQTLTRSVNGTGLGLTVSLSLARLLGGDIAAHSLPGEGSMFEMRLPLGAGRAAAGPGD